MTEKRTMFLGDSVAYGSTHGGRLAITPRENVNAAQSVFRIPAELDFTKGGASTIGWLSSDPAVREAHGLPSGASVDFLLAFSGCEAVLFCVGGNDAAEGYMDRIKTLAGKCQTHGKLFAFVGLIDIDADAAYSYALAQGLIAPGTSFYEASVANQTIPQWVATLAYNAELLRIVCRHENYPYIDTRTLVPPVWGDMTGDLVHPNQAYSTAIFNKVGRCIAGLP